MYVRFYVLNRSKYRFPFHAVYIGIMTGIRKPTFHAARYNRQKYLGSDVRSRPLQTAPVRTEGLFWRPHGCNIAAGTAPVPEAVAEVFQSFQKKFFRRGFLLSPDNSELYLRMPKKFSAYERCSLCEAGWRSRVTPPYNLRYDKFKKEDRTPDNDRSQSPQV